MDLGSGVCTPQTPNCSGCPVRSLCKTAALCSAATASTAAATASDGNSGSSSGSSSTAIATDNNSTGSDTNSSSSSCACTVCEKDDEGCVSTPTAVTDFPRKAEKAAAKNEVH
jgi:adenine-specific DNA glycosylase